MTVEPIPFFGGARAFETHHDVVLERIERVLASGRVVQGEAVAELEHTLAAKVGRLHGIAVASCTDALFFALQMAGVGPGDDVLVTDFSFIASAACITRVGADPVFVDIDGTCNMDLQKAAERVGARTRALIWVDLYGRMGDPVAVEGFAREHDLTLIEDAAQAFGSTFDGRPAGSLGQISCFSFGSTKPLAAPGCGGMVLVDDQQQARRARSLRYHGADHGGYAEIGVCSLMPTLAAEILIHKLGFDRQWRERRREIGRYYDDRLATLCPRLVLPAEPPGSVANNHKFVLRSDRRDELRTGLERRGVPTRVYYPRPLHRQACFSPRVSADLTLPEAEQAARTVLSLPIHAFLSDSEVERVMSAFAAVWAAL